MFILITLHKKKSQKAEKDQFAERRAFILKYGKEMVRKNNTEETQEIYGRMKDLIKNGDPEEINQWYWEFKEENLNDTTDMLSTINLIMGPL